MFCFARGVQLKYFRARHFWSAWLHRPVAMVLDHSAPMRPRCPRVIKFGSDFSGMEGAAAALRRMNIPHRCIFASDPCRASQRILHLVSKPRWIFDDITLRLTDPNYEEQAVDVYVTNPPCQDFWKNTRQVQARTGPKRTRFTHQ